MEFCLCKSGYVSVCLFLSLSFHPPALPSSVPCQQHGDHIPNQNWTEYLISGVTAGVWFGDSVGLKISGSVGIE